MRKACFIVSLLALCIIFNVSLAVAQQTAVPLLVMEETSFDFKEVREGEVLEHAFKVMNKGGLTLAIDKVQPG